MSPASSHKAILAAGIIGLVCTILGAAGFEMPPGQWSGFFEKTSGPLLGTGLVLLGLVASVIFSDQLKP